MIWLSIQKSTKRVSSICSPETENYLLNFKRFTLSHITASNSFYVVLKTHSMSALTSVNLFLNLLSLLPEFQFLSSLIDCNFPKGSFLFMLQTNRLFLFLEMNGKESTISWKYQKIIVIIVILESAYVERGFSFYQRRIEPFSSLTG